MFENAVLDEFAAEAEERHARLIDMRASQAEQKAYAKFEYALRPKRRKRDEE